MLLSFKRTIYRQHFIKTVGAILEKIEMFIFFLCELPLIFAASLK